MQCVILKTAIQVASKMIPATGRKIPTHVWSQDMSWLGGWESQNKMSVSSLGKYLNQDSAKYKFWLNKIHQELVLPNITAEERKELASYG